MIKFLIPFIVAFLAAVIVGYLFLFLAAKISWKERIAPRHIHKREVRRIGGIVMVMSFILAIFVNSDLVITPELWGFAGVSIFIVVAGIIDDIKEISWKMQFFTQILSAFFIFIIGIRIYYITNPISGGVINLDTGLGVIISAILVVFWLMLTMNSLNWIDGIDGLSGGIALISSIAIFFLSIKGEVNQPPIAIISAALSGAILGFLIFNFNPSKMLAGTSGAMFMGFALAILAIYSGTKIATASLVLAIPIIDLISVIIQRIRHRKSIFKADMRHLHFRLMELGWTQREIALVFYAITALIAIVALNTRAIGKLVTIIFAVVIMIASSFLIEGRTVSHDHDEEK
jgi:UDP-GlcNAc:undecaprenyl-phosphate/decaprenyl-phosphate GlcNAc-1-phosphate transferase